MEGSEVLEANGSARGLVYFGEWSNVGLITVSEWTAAVVVRSN